MGLDGTRRVRTPACRSSKKASGNDWTYVGWKRVAYADDLADIAAKGYYERHSSG